MKIICILLGITLSLCSNLHEKERGICNYEYADVECVPDQQDKGVCCMLDGHYRYFDNSCLACSEVRDPRNDRAAKSTC